ncbi:MAG: hypothetical protein QXL94_03580 [Candidatus Parvarchaeum sp.]
MNILKEDIPREDLYKIAEELLKDKIIMLDEISTLKQNLDLCKKENEQLKKQFLKYIGD